MENYIDRLYQERSELIDRINKLEEFLLSDNATSATTIQLSIMDIQRSAMKTYLQCLKSRIGFMEHDGRVKPEAV